jgi:DNA-binding response OmpR family regulator
MLTSHAEGGMTMRILVVDDDTSLTKLLKLVFESQGFGVTVANTGRQTLEILERELPEAILLDLMMPGMSGLEVCKTVRANPRTANVPIFVLTARSSPESRRELLEAGATQYLVKPVRPTDLINRIRAAVSAPTSSPAFVMT